MKVTNAQTHLTHMLKPYPILNTHKCVIKPYLLMFIQSGQVYT